MGYAAAYGLVVVVAGVLCWRRAPVGRRPVGVDSPWALHPVELGYLNQGPDLAGIVACAGLYDRGVLTRFAPGVGHKADDVAEVDEPGEDEDQNPGEPIFAAKGGLAVTFVADPDRHRLEQAAVAAVLAGADRRDLVAVLRTAPETDEIRDHLVEVGLLHDQSAGSTRRRGARWLAVLLTLGVALLVGLLVVGSEGAGPAAVLVAADAWLLAVWVRRRTQAGHAMVRAAVAGVPPSTAAGVAARRVAALGSRELEVVEPALARALGIVHLPRKRGRRGPGAIVSLSIRRRAANRGRMHIGNNPAEMHDSIRAYEGHGGWGDGIP